VDRKSHGQGDRTVIKKSRVSEETGSVVKLAKRQKVAVTKGKRQEVAAKEVLLSQEKGIST
jgi:hypothetical protein